MNKPKLKDFIEPVYHENEIIAHGVNFSRYAFALELYVKQLEQQIGEIEEFYKTEMKLNPVRC